MLAAPENVTTEVPLVAPVPDNVTLDGLKLAVRPVGTVVPSDNAAGPVNPFEPVTVTIAVALPDAPVTVVGLTVTPVRAAGWPTMTVAWALRVSVSLFTIVW